MARELMSATHMEVEVKKQVRGPCFMLNRKKYIGVEKERPWCGLTPHVTTM